MSASTKNYFFLFFFTATPGTGRESGGEDEAFEPTSEQERHEQPQAAKKKKVRRKRRQRKSGLLRHTFKTKLLTKLNPNRCGGNGATSRAACSVTPCACFRHTCPSTRREMERGMSLRPFPTARRALLSSHKYPPPLFPPHKYRPPLLPSVTSPLTDQHRGPTRRLWQQV